MEAGYVKSFQVRDYECDAYGHLNNANYVRYMHETTLEALSRMSAQDARGESARGVWYPRQLFVDYLQPAYYGDTLQVRAQPVYREDDRLVWEYEFRKEPPADGLIRAQLTYGSFDLQAGTWQPISQELIGMKNGTKPVDVEFPRQPPLHKEGLSRAPGWCSGGMCPRMGWCRWALTWITCWTSSYRLPLPAGGPTSMPCRKAMPWWCGASG